ncbi:MAG: pyruvate, phosphate dikinase, partial [Lactobacillaceae bacterium]|nr:pyruvate, phosphate dikinase [Lactobacillaceae bacterium]
MSKWVYTFGNGHAEGDASMKNLLGGKGANLAEMNRVGLPVPPGFTVTTEVCTYYYANGKKYPSDLEKQVKDGVAHAEKIMGKKFADANDPLLFSVRSGARVSMPGMMNTVLNLGLNDQTVKALAKAAGDERFAYDSYRRFIMMYSDVVLEADIDLYEHALEAMKEKKGYKVDTELTAADLKTLVEEYKAISAKIGKVFPQDPWEQLMGGIGAVFNSWMVKKAVTYRKLNNIPGDWGTAVNVQAMVFGNAGDDCATGVCFSRDPSTGENMFYGEYLTNAQGEDVVAGIRTPLPMAHVGGRKDSLEDVMPSLYKELNGYRLKLEQHYKDMQDMEFTIENGKLYFLQTRNGKRTAFAALKIAVDMVEEKVLSDKDALLKIDPRSLDALLHPTFVPADLKSAKHIAEGLAASPGAACGKVVFTASRAVELKNANPKEKMILVRLETCPDDIEGMVVCQGILTARGGMTSHAAVVARGMGTCCVAGCGELKINEDAKYFEVGGKRYTEGDVISIDGSTG